ncbi:N-acetyltransferase eso1 [Neolecta irregularis DAH-3]|uniref:DNA polymerase eta n=1 Tax=Neolecta irregularis (strain DAH-3) TaxID=1198029 RepID=A0A1U7LTL5_NEOID|nr:N-acetyltransferase eso1 [Neolecta irregularis DAH-3]|eukprot:OLL26007.1 N-acetyltransferase eso1 [Neolecta irregularis DAH-3]
MSLPPSSWAATATSRFSFRHLAPAAMRAPARDSPLRVIAHIDLDAFYSQVELVRLQLSPDTPLAVQQWRSIIAVNYPARAFGLTRHETIESALLKCPHLVLQHVQTWKEDQVKPHYHLNPDMATHKVSLDPYRREGRKILEIFRQHCDTVEKASVDESFLDLSTLVREKLLDRYPYLAFPPDGDASCNLPLPLACNWIDDHGTLIPLSQEESEEGPPDWDDICLQIGAEIVRDIRLHVLKELKYTCSAGVAKNKMLAKLCSAYRKPNQQTIIRDRAVMGFLADLKFTKIRNLGGKLGEQVSESLNTELCRELWRFSVDELRGKLGLETGPWVYSISRGIDYSEVNPRTQIKSMMSAKNFRPNIGNIEQAERWMRILTADLASRLLEDPLSRRPKTITLHHRGINRANKSRQAPIPIGKELTADYTSYLAVSLMKSLESENGCYPCTMLSVGLTGFEGAEDGVRGISAFLLKGEEAKLAKRTAESFHLPGLKKTKTGGIQRFFESSETKHDGVQKSKGLNNAGSSDTENSKDYSPEAGYASPKGFASPLSSYTTLHDEEFCFRCDKCNGKLIPFVEREEHDDWHFAKGLSKDDRPLPSVRQVVKLSKRKSSPSEAKSQRKLQFR